MDQPTRENDAYVWLPHPGDGQAVPEIALEYPGEAGRHSGTYPATGLERGRPALKITIHSADELDQIVGYIRALSSSAALPDVKIRTDVKAPRGWPSRPAHGRPCRPRPSGGSHCPVSLR